MSHTLRTVLWVEIGTHYLDLGASAHLHPHALRQWCSVERGGVFCAFGFQGTGWAGMGWRLSCLGSRSPGFQVFPGCQAQPNQRSGLSCSGAGGFSQASISASNLRQIDWQMPGGAHLFAAHTGIPAPTREDLS
jgi:hypothetical protein